MIDPTYACMLPLLYGAGAPEAVRRPAGDRPQVQRAAAARDGQEEGRVRALVLLVKGTCVVKSMCREAATSLPLPAFRCVWALVSWLARS